jgi:hypothetical protein
VGYRLCYLGEAKDLGRFGCKVTKLTNMRFEFAMSHCSLESGASHSQSRRTRGKSGLNYFKSQGLLALISRS